jgi:C1A family cysteine protease
MKNLGLLIYLSIFSLGAFAATLPSQFDLRNADGNNYLTVVKSQIGGTDWAYATVAALESNLMRTGVWLKAGESGEPSLSEDHLDWWNGFNQHFNADASPHTGGTTLAPHEGGDYKMAAAYLARGEGAIRREQDSSSFFVPEHTAGYFHHYYAREIEWLSAKADLSNINVIKQAVRDHGALATSIAWSPFFYSSTTNSFYQPAYDNYISNHGTAIVGWDDQKVTQSPRPGAWLAKNSWGSKFGHSGFFWISYDDKNAAKDPERGAVSFHSVEPMQYQGVYYHDYHGWRDTKTDVSEAFNAFVAAVSQDGSKEILKAVSFYTAAEKVHFTAKVYGKFDGRQLSEELATQEGDIAHPGHHTIDLAKEINLTPGQHFYIYVKLSAGGHAVDRSGVMPTLLGTKARNTKVESSARPGESFYRSETRWVDLTEDDWTANFCMKGLVTRY